MNTRRMKTLSVFASALALAACAQGSSPDGSPGCLTDRDCPGNLACVKGTCGTECLSDRDCPQGTCLDGKCTADARVAGEVAVDVPGGAAADVYYDGEKVGSGTSVPIDVPLPAGADRLLMAQVPGTPRVWVNLVSNDGSQAAPTGGSLRIDARTTAASYLQLFPPFLATRGELNAIVARVIWEASELDAVAQWLEAHASVPDVSSEPELVDLLHAAAIAVVPRLNAAVDELASKGESSMSTLDFEMGVYKRGVWGQGEWGREFNTEWTVANGQVQLSYGLGGANAILPEWARISLFALDGLALFGEVDKRGIDVARDITPTFNVGVDRHWPIKAGTGKLNIVKAKPVTELIDIWGVVSDMLVDHTFWNVVDDYGQVGAPKPSVSSSKLGLYSVRFVLGGIGGSDGQKAFVVQDPELKKRWAQALMMNCTKIAFKLLSAADASMLTKDLGDKFLEKAFEKLNPLYFDPTQMNKDRLADFMTMLVETGVDVFVQDAVMAASAKSMLQAYLGEVGRAATAVWSKPGQISDGLHAYATYSQLALHPFSAQLIWVGDEAMLQCLSDYDCFANEHCDPGANQCRANETCNGNPALCDDGNICTDDVCIVGGSGGYECEHHPNTSPGCGSVAQSCAGGLYCGSTSCCESILLPAGTFPMGRSTSGSDAYSSGYSDEQPEHNATVDSFYLDRFEVTVGRFRKWVNVYDGNPPGLDGDGAHPKIPGSGWSSAWNQYLPGSQSAMKSNLKCAPSYQTWTDSPGQGESRAINCVSWYEAFAFCIWDGGRLPTEAEWEYAAAGGSENRLYPWGSAAPSSTLANYYQSAGTPLLDVGSYPAGRGRWGHDDLAGNMWEWTLDWYSSSWYSGAGNTCVNCANVTNASYRVVRGGSWYDGDGSLRAADRFGGFPSYRYDYYGFRCARTP